MLVALLGLGAVVFDYGAAVTQRRNMQNVADAAALAGAQELDGTSAAETAATAKAIEYINKNVSDLAGSPEITFNGAHTEITVKVAKTSPSFFLGTFGLGDNDIGAKATAGIRAVPLGPGVAPFTVDVDTATMNGLIVLKEVPQGTNPPLGGQPYFGYVNPCPASPDDCNLNSKAEICKAFYQGAVNVQDPVQQSNGNKSSFTACLADRLARAAIGPAGTDQLGNSGPCLSLDDVSYTSGGVRYLKPHCNPLGDAAATGNPLIQPTAVLVIPVVTDYSCVKKVNGKCEFDVVGTGNEDRRFAYFWVTDQYCQPNGSGNRESLADGVHVGEPATHDVLTAPKPTNTPNPTNTPAPPTSTPTPKKNATPTNTPTTPTATRTPSGGTATPTPTSTPSLPPGQCQLSGQFIQNEYLPLRPSGSEYVDYTGDSVLRVVVLID